MQLSLITSGQMKICVSVSFYIWLIEDYLLLVYTLYIYSLSYLIF